VQFVFAVKYRKAVLHKSWRDELYKYITEIITANSHKLIVINGVEDHIHILVGLRPSQSISELLKIIKQSSSLWINKKQFLNTRFEWQNGYGAFSYSKSHLDRVIRYINNQERHHHKKSFIDEYLEYLQKFEIEHDEKFVFKELV